MSRSATSAPLCLALLVAISTALGAQTAGTTGSSTAPANPSSSATSSSTASSASSSTTKSDWVVGLARFLPAVQGEGESILLSTLPRLIAADLGALPTRRISESDAAEIARLNSLRDRFAAGSDLAAKLDARASGFFDPSVDVGAKKASIDSADKAVSDSQKKLDDALQAHEVEGPTPPSDLVARLWSGNAQGQLIDPPTNDLAKSAKTASVNLLVVGSVALESGYARVVVSGFDAALGRVVFAWKSYCSVDDPEPLALDMARRLERWIAGRDFARLELRPLPASAELRINGELLSGSSRVAYVYRPGAVVVSALAAGYAPYSTAVDLSLGEEKTQDIVLQPLVTGSVTLSTDPSDASISLDSIPQGKSPLSIGLDGSRTIVSASAEGKETQTIVLPSSGDANIDLKLQPSDGLGPSGRISASKDRFYSSLGWFVLSIPVTALSYGAYYGYDEAYLRSGSSSLYNARNTAVTVTAVAGTATAVTAVFMIIRLIKYLGTAH